MSNRLYFYTISDSKVILFELKYKFIYKFLKKQVLSDYFSLSMVKITNSSIADL